MTTFEDYETLVTWLEGWGWKPMPREVLPSVGLVLEDVNTGRPLCMGFLYLCDGTTMAFMDFIVADPTLSAASKVRSCNEVIAGLIAEARTRLGPNGFIVTLSTNTGYLRMAGKQGFRVAENNATSMFYSISGLEQVDFLCEE